MISSGDGDIVSDAVLTAYLDDELALALRVDVERTLQNDPHATDRLVTLASGRAGLAPAFGLLLDAAPMAKLEAALARAVAPALKPPPVAVRRRFRRTYAALAACLLVAIVGSAGFLAGRAPPAFLAGMLGRDEWLESVARQVSLYTSASLAAVDVDTAAQAEVLGRGASAIGLDLTLHSVQLPGYTLKQVQNLQVEDRPLLQLLYVGSETGPIALCITNEAGEDGERASYQIAGQNLVYWVADGFGFLIVGGAPSDGIKRLADIAASRLPLPAEPVAPM